MLKFISKNLKIEKLPLSIFESNNFELFWQDYVEIAKKNNRVIGDPSFIKDDNAINVLCIRNNPEISFNLKEYYYNDYLIVSVNVSNNEKDFYVYKVTADPKGKKNGIAHLLEGVYNSYRIRNHRWIPGRIAICQDINKVFVGRTDANGNLITVENGFFGINIHDSSIYPNSSLGCTVLEPDGKDNGFHYEKSFKPLLQIHKEQKVITYAVCNYSYFIRSYFYLKLENKDFYLDRFAEQYLFTKAKIDTTKFVELVKPFNIL